MLTQVGGAGCLLASTQLEESTAKRRAGLLATETLITCGVCFSRGGGTRSRFIIGL